MSEATRGILMDIDGIETAAILGRGVGQAFNVLGDTVTLKARSRVPDWALFEVEARAQAAVPPHHHPWDELYIVTEGRLEVMVGKDWHSLGQGDIAAIPAGTPHTFRLGAGARARFMTFVAPGQAVAFFAALDALRPQGEADLPKVVELAARHGVMLA